MQDPAINSLAVSTLYAAKPVSPLVAEIACEFSTVVTVRFPARQEEVVTVCRDLGFRWVATAWKATTDQAQDRAAEVAHRLLAAGIHCRMSDSSIRAKALAGDFKPKPARWIAVFTRSEKYLGWFAVCWKRSEDWYEEARRLPGSRYEKPFVAAPREAWREVLDFASAHGFEVLASAAKLADQMKAVEDAAIHVQVQALPRSKASRGRRVLTAGMADTTIPDDLKDEP